MASTPTYRALINDAAQLLYNGSDTPRIDAEILLQHIVARPMAWFIAYGDTFATADHIRDYAELVEQRHSGQPIAYLTGYKEFWTLKLKVNEHVLIPRADTETLVEHALELLDGVDQPRILDLGTGSGAIALALAKERKDAAVFAVDISTQALGVARENAQLHNLSNVQFIQSSWYTELGEQQFNLIAANPPYVAPDDEHLEQGDLRFEPAIALSAKDNGLADLQNIIRNAPDYLAPSGVLITEHGYNQGEEAAALFAQAGFTDVTGYKDINRLPRCTSGKAKHA